MKKRSIFFSVTIALFAITSQVFGQGYVFTDVVVNPATSVKNQASSGTCWSYATAAFIEAELLRTGRFLRNVHCI